MLAVHYSETILANGVLTLSLMQTLSGASAADGFLKNIVTEEKLLFLSHCSPLLVIGYLFNYRDVLCFDKICSKSSAAELLYEGKG